jgi:hypothetical protein
MGFEPMSTGFADQRVNHFAIGALESPGAGERHTPRDAVDPIVQPCRAAVASGQRARGPSSPSTTLRCSTRHRRHWSASPHPPA